MITLLLVIYTLIAGWLSYYLLTHQSRPFLFFDPNKAPTIKHVARYGGVMLLVTIACFVTIFVQATMLIAIVLASGSLIMMAIALILVSFMQIS